tara:strand:+ start:25 stop:255 length:231 start_codon:yes stop_codon:yes gene_type:complete
MKNNDHLKVVIEFREGIFKEYFLDKFRIRVHRRYAEMKLTTKDMFLNRYPTQSITEIDGTVIWESDFPRNKIQEEN